MRAVARYALGIAMGLAAGIGSALYAGQLLTVGGGFDAPVDVDGWRGDFAIGTSQADPYTRARIARHGLLALARSEAVYLTRAVDDAGQPLREACTYRVSGGPMPAGWWSITLYDAQSFLPPNDDGATSFDATEAGDGNWNAIVSPTPPADRTRWISSRNAGPFDLTLRLYMPDPALIAAPESTLTAPSIARLSCEGDPA